MVKWLLAVLLILVLLEVFRAQFAKLGLGRLPGDFRFKHKGRQYYLPLTSTVVLSGLVLLAQRFLRF